MSVPVFMFPNFSILFHLLSPLCMHVHVHRNIFSCEIKLKKYMLSFSSESFMFLPFKVRTYRTILSHTAFCGFCKLNHSYCGKNIGRRCLVAECW
jgi:hypothetical protein